MEPIPDFSKRQHFPGTFDNNFDVILRRADDVDRLPGWAFALLLLLVALPPTWGQWDRTVSLWGFMLVDWLLLAQLNRVGRSFGPSKPPTLVLAVLRMLFAFVGLWNNTASLVLQVAGTLLVAYAFWLEPQRIAITRQTLKSTKLKAGHPVRVLHLGDLHVERITERERALNRMIEALRPDIILFSGDILNLSFIEDPQAWQAAREVMGAWQAPGGVYAVSGSPAVDLAHIFPRLVEGLPLTWLDNRRAMVALHGQTLDIVGVTCTHKPFIDGPQLETLLNEDPHQAERFTILLYHTPDLAPNAANTGRVDLQVSGHTHGGQVRLPLLGALFAGSLYGKRFEAGRYTIGGLTLYVSRGIGLEGKAAPRVRFLCAPEIILWELDGLA